MGLVAGFENRCEHTLNRTAIRTLDLLVDAIEGRHLLARGADHGYDIGAGTGFERRRDLPRKHAAVDDRPERRKRISEFLLQPGEFALRRQKLCDRQGLELILLVGLEA